MWVAKHHRCWAGAKRIKEAHPAAPAGAGAALSPACPCLTSYFPVTRSVRQGCPLSSSLYCLGAGGRHLDQQGSLWVGNYLCFVSCLWEMLPFHYGSIFRNVFWISSKLVRWLNKWTKKRRDLTVNYHYIVQSQIKGHSTQQRKLMLLSEMLLSLLTKINSFLTGGWHWMASTSNSTPRSVPALGQ